VCSSDLKDITYSVTPTATTNYTGTVVTTVFTDVDDESLFITLTDTTNITEKTFISINNETMYVESLNSNIITVIRGVYGTTAKTHIAGSDVKNVTTIDNNLIVYGDSFGIFGELI
jgi:hypothetical protein